MIDMKKRAEAFGDLEAAVCDCADMAKVCIILLDHHYAQVAATEMDLACRQAIVGIKPSFDALDFGIRQLATMARVLGAEYYGQAS